MFSAKLCGVPSFVVGFLRVLRGEYKRKRPHLHCIISLLFARLIKEGQRHSVILQSVLLSAESLATAGAMHRQADENKTLTEARFEKGLI